MKQRWCRCGHYVDRHAGPSTECYGTVPGGRNAAGVKRREGCPCKSFRPTSRSWWQLNVTLGPEEAPR